MRVKFQAEADLDGRLLRGLRRSASEIDIRTAAEAGLAVLEDPAVLRIAADSGRILISQDRWSMPTYCSLQGWCPKLGCHPAARSNPISTAIEELVLVWRAGSAMKKTPPIRPPTKVFWMLKLHHIAP
jgi:hypothetical protein